MEKTKNRTVILKQATMGNVSFRLNAHVDDKTKYDEKGIPKSDFCYELEIVSEGTCGHHSIYHSTSIFLTETEGADKVAKFFLELNEL